MKPTRPQSRSGQSLVEFAVVALVMYMLLAAIVTFGHMLYVAQGLQSAADLAAREMSRTNFNAVNPVSSQPLTFEDVTTTQVGLADNDLFRTNVYDEAWLVIDLDKFYAEHPGGSVFEILVPQMPPVNQQLAVLMIVDRPLIAPPETIGPFGEVLPPGPPVLRRFLRYPGALLPRQSAIQPPSSSPNYPSSVLTEFKVEIPLVDETGAVTSVVDVIEEIRAIDDPVSPFSVSHPRFRGIVALRMNYPFQSASMSSFRRNPEGPFEPTIGNPVTTDDDADVGPGEVYSGTHGGTNGLGVQGALGQRVRPFRRVISAQAIYRREIFAAPPPLAPDPIPPDPIPPDPSSP